MPPSMPVEETRVPEEESPMTEITETVSSPPSAQSPVEEQTSPSTMPTPPVPEDDFSNDITDPNDHPDDAKTPVGMEPPAPHNSFYRNNPEKRAAFGLPPVESPENKKPKTVEQQHKAAFNTAFNEMTGDEMRAMNQALDRGIDDAFAAANREAKRLGREDAKESSREPTPPPKPDKAVVETAKKTIKTQEEESKKPESDSEINVRPLRLADKNPPKYGRLVESGKGVIGSILHTDAKEQGLTRVMMPGNKIGYMKGTPKPDKEVVDAAKKNIKPKKTATEKGKSAVRAASDRLARSGMKGDTKDESPKE